MKNVIEIDVFDEKEFFEIYNKKLVADSLINYLVDQTPNFKNKETLKIKINSKITSDIDLKKCIVEGLKNKYQESYQNHFRNTIIQLIYLLVGVLIIFASTLIKREVFREVILICGWVLIWATVELEIFSDIEGRKRRKKLKRLIDSEFIINRIN